MATQPWLTYLSARAFIVFLRSIAPASVVYLGACCFKKKFILSPVLGGLAIAEAAFLFFVYLPRRALLQEVSCASFCEGSWLNIDVSRKQSILRFSIGGSERPFSQSARNASLEKTMITRLLGSDLRMISQEKMLSSGYSGHSFPPGRMLYLVENGRMNSTAT